jgi:hypothetical protein
MDDDPIVAQTIESILDAIEDRLEQIVQGLEALRELCLKQESEE